MKLSNSKLLSITIALLGVIWAFGIYVVSTLYDPAPVCIGGVVFGMVTVVASVLYLVFFRTSPSTQSVENGGLPVYASIAYVVSSLSANTIFVLTQRGHFNKLLVLVNIFMSAVYFIVILFAEKDVQRSSQQLDRMERSTEKHINISEKLGILLSMTVDSEIRRQILKLKEYIDYSSNVSTGNTYEAELEMDARLSEIINMISNHAEESAVRDKLHNAEVIWKTHSTKLSSGR